MSTNGHTQDAAQTNGDRLDDGKVRVAIVGVGNCANSFIQGVEYYKDADPAEQVPGLMHVDLGGYHVRDIEFVAAFDIDSEKVGKDLSEAIWSGQNDTIKFADVPELGVEVHRGMTHDGLGKYLKQKITKAPGETADIIGILKETKADVLVCYLPVGSEAATKWYVEQALQAGVGFVNCLPVFIARQDDWDKRFAEAGLPIIGDDIKSQVGATIVHRQLARLFHERGVELQHTSQLNVGGNMDFFNMLERERLDSKKISKTNAVTSVMGTELPEDDVHVGPSDYVPWLTDRKWAHIRLEGKSFGDVPLNLELKLEVWDSPNSAGVVIDAVRLIKLALNNGIAGQLDGPSCYLMKSPHTQRPDDEARVQTEEFIAKNARTGRLRAPPRKPRSDRGRGLEADAPPPGHAPGAYPAAVARSRLSIAQVTPHPWGARHEVNEFSARVAAELAERGHRVLSRRPPSRAAAVRESRAAIRVGRRPAGGAVRRRWTGARAGDDGPPVLALGQGIPLPRGPRPRAAPLPLDVSRALEGCSRGVDFDVVHVHDPFRRAPRSAALRHSRGAQRRQLPRADRARPLDPGRAALGRDLPRPSRRAHRLLRARPSCWNASSPAPTSWSGPAPTRARALVAAARRRRAASARCGSSTALARSGARCGSSFAPCAGFDLDLDWEAAIWCPTAAELPGSRKRLRDRVHVVGPGATARRGAGRRRRRRLRRSGGPQLGPGLVRTALAAGTVPVVSQIALYAELTRGRRARALFPPGDAITLAGQLERLVGDAQLLRGARRRPAAHGRRAWATVADQVEEIYGRHRGPPPRPAGQPEVRRRIVAAALDRRRPAHAHRPLPRLRDAGRDSARDRAAAAASARSRSPTTTRSPARSRPPRSPRHTGSR